jgi:hypothetical protein
LEFVSSIDCQLYHSLVGSGTNHTSVGIATGATAGGNKQNNEIWNSQWVATRNIANSNSNINSNSNSVQTGINNNQMQTNS